MVYRSSNDFPSPWSTNPRAQLTGFALWLLIGTALYLLIALILKEYFATPWLSPMDILVVVACMVSILVTILGHNAASQALMFVVGVVMLFLKVYLHDQCLIIIEYPRELKGDTVAVGDAICPLSDGTSKQDKPGWLIYRCKVPRVRDVVDVELESNRYRARFLPYAIDVSKQRRELQVASFKPYSIINWAAPRISGLEYRFLERPDREPLGDWQRVTATTTELYEAGNYRLAFRALPCYPETELTLGVQHFSSYHLGHILPARMTTSCGSVVLEFPSELFGATVHFDGGYFTADAAILRYERIAGAYPIEVTKRCFEPWNGTVHIRPEEETRIRVVARSTCGAVRLELPSELESGRVVIDDTEHESKGRVFTLDEIPEGTISVLVESDFYCAQQDVAVVAGDTTSVELSPIVRDVLLELSGVKSFHGKNSVGTLKITKAGIRFETTLRKVRFTYPWDSISSIELRGSRAIIRAPGKGRDKVSIENIFSADLRAVIQHEFNIPFRTF